MITKEYNDYLCFITQHDHASISFDIFMYFHEDVVGNLKNNENLKYAIRNHDVGSIEYDKVPKISENREVYTFQNMKQSLQEELWLRSISSAINPYSQLLISEHFKKLHENSKSRNEDDEFINKASELIENVFKGTKIPDTTNNKFVIELRFLQICDLLSLILCRERDIESSLIPKIFSYKNEVVDLKFEKVADSTYKFAPGILKTKRNFIEIPYKMLESKLILRPKQLKEEYKSNQTRFRKIELIS